MSGSDSCEKRELELTNVDDCHCCYMSEGSGGLIDNRDQLSKVGIRHNESPLWVIIGIRANRSLTVSTLACGR